MTIVKTMHIVFEHKGIELELKIERDNGNGIELDIIDSTDDSLGNDDKVIYEIVKNRVDDPRDESWVFFEYEYLEVYGLAPSAWSVVKPGFALPEEYETLSDDEILQKAKDIIDFVLEGKVVPIIKEVV